MYITPRLEHVCSIPVFGAKLGRDLTENRLNRNKLWCAAGNHNYMSHVCAKGFLDLNFNKAVTDKISNFQEIAPNFTYSQKSQSFKYNCNFFTHNASSL